MLLRLLFNVYAEATLREALDSMDEGIKIGAELMETVQFAGNQAKTYNTEE